MSETRSIPLAEIRIDGGTQPRAAISEATYKDYAERVAAGKVFPPIDVFHDGAEYWLADGYHRFFAAKWLERTCITATVHAGTRRDAVLFSVGANHGHGLQRTNADKRKAVMTLLDDSEWTEWSNIEIAKRCGVSDHLVGDIRSLRTNRSEDAPRTYTTKHGTEATMHVENIGKRKPPNRTVSDREREVIERLQKGQTFDVISTEMQMGDNTIRRIRDDAGLQPKIGRTSQDIEARREQMRAMAADGHTSIQIADALGVGIESCRGNIRRLGIDVPGDRATKHTKRLVADRIVETIVIDAENLTSAANLIDYKTLDVERLGPWIDSLSASRRALDVLIKRLVKEQQKHGQQSAEDVA